VEFIYISFMSWNGPSATQDEPSSSGLAMTFPPSPPNPVVLLKIGDPAMSSQSSVQSQYLREPVKNSSEQRKASYLRQGPLETAIILEMLLPQMYKHTMPWEERRSSMN